PDAHAGGSSGPAGRPGRLAPRGDRAARGGEGRRRRPSSPGAGLCPRAAGRGPAHRPGPGPARRSRSAGPGTCPRRGSGSPRGMRRAPQGLRVERLRAAEHPVLRRMYDAYLAELSGFGGPYRRRADGRWDYLSPGGEWGLDHLPYWLEPGVEHLVLLFRRGRAAVGFAMVGVRGALWMSPGIDACISEFYVVPKARERGV